MVLVSIYSVALIYWCNIIALAAACKPLYKILFFLCESGLWTYLLLKHAAQMFVYGTYMNFMYTVNWSLRRYKHISVLLVVVWENIISTVICLVIEYVICYNNSTEPGSYQSKHFQNLYTNVINYFPQIHNLYFYFLPLLLFVLSVFSNIIIYCSTVMAELNMWEKHKPYKQFVP